MKRFVLSASVLACACATAFSVASVLADTSASPLPRPIRSGAGSDAARVSVPPYRIGRPAHVLRDTSILEPRFQDVLEKGVEYRAIIELDLGDPGATGEAGAALAGGGRVEIALFAETAPNHVANFVSLARKGFFNGLTFHRVIPGFMAQGGDPTGTGSGGPGYTVNAEFSSTPHLRGTLSMARTPDPNSAGSQFFICYVPRPDLDRQYTVFGSVVSGMVHVDKLKPRDPRSNPAFTGSVMKRVTIMEIRRTAPARPRRIAPEATPAAPSETGSLPRPEVGRRGDGAPVRVSSRVGRIELRADA
jgi:cyclophilin family peptidyl-prolyl cis-trans isomerase